ncbi:signal peptidase II [Sanguibacter sp. 25GB23B1]|uniref:signal peptidase II n=1 Tax=unclassified Sanguibacter TaxID=2645534 RepID=UPI0032AEA997
MSETSDNPAIHDPVDGTDGPSARTTRRPGVYLAMIFGIAFLVLLVDQLSKVWAESELVAGEPARPLLGDLVGLRLIYNSGAALSFGSGMTWVLTLLSVVVVVFIAYSARRIRSTSWALALGLVLGGALGNLIDRLFRAPGFPEGHVVDFIDYGPFIGNVADIAIVVAAVAIAILAFVGIGPDGERASSTPTDAASTDPASTGRAPSEGAVTDTSSTDPGSDAQAPVEPDPTRPESSGTPARRADDEPTP